MNDQSAFEAQRCFYEKCCELLELPQYFIPIHYRLTRWNNRLPGNGRMEGYGQIRRYSANLIHVCFRSPVSINRTFKSEEEVYDFLSSLLSSQDLTFQPAS